MSEFLHDCNGLAVAIDKYLEWMKGKDYSPSSIRSRKHYLCFFARWCQEHEIARVEDVTRAMVERYQLYLLQVESAKCAGILSENSRHRHMRTVYLLFKWLMKRNCVLINPAQDLEMPERSKRLPHNVLNVSEVECVLAQANLKTGAGIRDRAIMETLYSTGMRRSELVHLMLHDVDMERGTVFISQGKGKKDRIVPIGERALLWIEKYLREVRPKMAKQKEERELFLTKYGKAFRSADCLTSLLGKYIKAANLGKSGACHIFRHSMATLMLENGADIRYIQEMLGHECLNTTEIYTKVSIAKLKEVHERTHPTAK